MIPEVTRSIGWQLMVTAIVAACLFLLDVWVLRVPLASLLICFPLLLCFVVMGLLSLFRRYRPIVLKKIPYIGILFVGVVGDAGIHYISKRLVASKAVKLGDACLAYRKKYN